MDLVVIGLGYVGLPLTRAAIRAGYAVVGLDRDSTTVNNLNRGRSHVDDVSDDDVSAMLDAGFRATTDDGVLAEAETIVICVPTPLSADSRPDLTAVRSASAAIAERLHRNTLVILESTTYPGTTDEVVRPILEKTGLVAGLDFHLGFSPERIDPGNPAYDLRNTPKVVGGHTEACAKRCVAFYSRFVDTVVTARGTREAEMAKLLENTYRHVNIALVNEMARFCQALEVDIWDVIRCAATKPFGFQAFHPSAGVGGHCIPVDPNYLSYKVNTLGYPFRFVELAQEINMSMPGYVVRRVQDMLNDRGSALRGAEVLLLGVTYKPDISDRRNSPADPVARLLAERGALVSYHDPLVRQWSVDGLAIPHVTDLAVALPASDVTVLLQPHRTYDLSFIAEQAQLLFDATGRTEGTGTVRL